MDFKKFWKEKFAGFVLKNLLIAIGIIVVLSWGILIGIDFYTRHGESERVPDLRGMYLEEAQAVLSPKGLYVKVVDSVYVRGKRLGTIISQTPGPNSNVKTNRAIFIIINSRNVKQISLPELKDVSYRQAEAVLQSLGLTISKVEYATSEFKDLVLSVKYQGRSLSAGSKIPEGSEVILVVGNGMTDGEETDIPMVKGKSLEEGSKLLETAGFTIGAIEYDVPPNGNETEYIIYRQRPGGGSKASSGSRIDLFLSTDKSRVNEKFEEDKKSEETEQFF